MQVVLMTVLVGSMVMHAVTGQAMHLHAGHADVHVDWGDGKHLAT